MSDDRWVRVPTDQETKALIRKLKDKGYMVVHRDSVRTIGAIKAIPKEHLLEARFPVAQMVREDLALSLSRELLHHWDFAVRETSRGVTAVEFRAELTWLGSRISLEDSEYPLFLQHCADTTT